MRVVALRKESVDRNFTSFKTLRSKSEVALRKESVDRNANADGYKFQRGLSLSARRAWIEIRWEWRCCWHRAVALRKESVDRNVWLCMAAQRGYGRSPQGERG